MSDQPLLLYHADIYCQQGCTAYADASVVKPYAISGHDRA